MAKRSKITFGQLDKVLRSLGFSCTPSEDKPPSHWYEHKTGALIVLPRFSENERVYEHHLFAARLELDNFGLATPAVFEAKLQKAG